MGFLPWLNNKNGRNVPQNNANPWNIDLTPYIKQRIMVYQYGTVKTNNGQEEVRHTRQSGYLSAIHTDGSFWLGATPKPGNGGRNVKAYFNGGGVDMATYKITTINNQGSEMILYYNGKDFSGWNIIDKDSSAPE